MYMKSIFKFVKFIVFMCMLILCVGVGYFAYSGYNLYKQKMDEIPLNEMVSSIKSKDNYVGYDSIALDFFHAIVAIEDKRFYYHKGVDLASVIRAIVTDYNNKELSQGGSTITQQLAKNMYFSQVAS